MARLFGIETEYGLAIEGRGAAQQAEDSVAFVSSCPFPSFLKWDHAYETPRTDLRGFSVQALAYDPVDAQFDTNESDSLDENAAADRVLANGSRFYSDHGHPEYATPECSRILDLLAHDLAGERILLATADAYEERTGRRVTLYKNNSDFHGASYGTHENYLFRRDVDLKSLVEGLVPFLIVRPILFGAGKVGSEDGKPCRFQLSQRADFIHEIANIETLYRRPLFNTRDEPHADPTKYRRVHIICGDANRMQWAIAMKVATTCLVLDLITIDEAPRFALCAPVRAAQSISRDEAFKWQIELEHNSWTTGPEVLAAYFAAAERFFKGRDAETDWALKEWSMALSDLSTDPMKLTDRVDWAAKLAILYEYAETNGWKDSVMKSFDLQYHNLNPEDSLYAAWSDMGYVRKIANEARIIDAVSNPPATTRAYIRGLLVNRFCDRVQTMGWRRFVANGTSVELSPVPTNWVNLSSCETFTEIVDFIRANSDASRKHDTPF